MRIGECGLNTNILATFKQIKLYEFNADMPFELELVFMIMLWPLIAAVPDRGNLFTHGGYIACMRCAVVAQDTDWNTNVYEMVCGLFVPTIEYGDQISFDTWKTSQNVWQALSEWFLSRCPVHYTAPKHGCISQGRHHGGQVCAHAKVYHVYGGEGRPNVLWRL